jgi:formate C-acetyltransferase
MSMPLNATPPLTRALPPRLPDSIREFYSKVRKTHNTGVFDAYTDEMKRARKSGILTGLPDGYGRGRIIGDYR